MTISVYPTLLNYWQDFCNQKGYEKQGEEILFIPDEQAMLDKINRKDRVTTEAMQRGIDFEDYVLGRKPCPSGPIEAPVTEVKRILPKRGMDNKLTYGVYGTEKLDIIIYGYMDYLVSGAIFDIKSIGRYDEVNKYANSHQLWYLRNMEPFGFRKMCFVVENNNNVFVETYDRKEIDWVLLWGEISLLTEFLQDNRDKILDQRIFTDVTTDRKFTDCFRYDYRRRETHFL